MRTTLIFLLMIFTLKVSAESIEEQMSELAARKKDFNKMKADEAKADTAMQDDLERLVRLHDAEAVRDERVRERYVEKVSREPYIDAEEREKIEDAKQAEIDLKQEKLEKAFALKEEHAQELIEASHVLIDESAEYDLQVPVKHLARKSGDQKSKPSKKF